MAVRRLQSSQYRTNLKGKWLVYHSLTSTHCPRSQALFAYCCLKEGFEDTEMELSNELRLQVRKRIGPIAVPDYLVIVPGLPKTRSGKIMRRILRKIANHETKPEQLGDVSTLAEPQVVNQLINIVEQYMAAHSKQHSS